MTHAFLAESYRRRTKMTQQIWEHECCGEMYWSAARRCDRCGAAATSTVSDLSIADAFAGRKLPPLTLSRPAAQPDPASPQLTPATGVTPAAAAPSPAAVKTGATAAVPRSREEVENLLVCMLWWATGAVSVLLGLGALVEFSDANYLSSVALAMGASSTPLASLCAALDGRLQRFVLRQFQPELRSSPRSMHPLAGRTALPCAD